MVLAAGEIRRSRSAYREDEGLLKLARMASIQEAEGYSGRFGPGPPVPAKPRVLEVCELARKLEVELVGLAFCTGLRREAALFQRILEARGFAVASVSCKAGATPKESLGLSDDQKIGPGGFEAMCSPVAQAMVLNSFRTGLNVVVGLCVGHDSIFFRYSEAPVTVLVAKDRLLCHNPAGALYCSPGYHRYLTRRGAEEDD
jgi:uncharacterized metal-binding protein